LGDVAGEREPGDLDGDVGLGEPRPGAGLARGAGISCRAGRSLGALRARIALGPLGPAGPSHSIPNIGLMIGQRISACSARRVPSRGPRSAGQTCRYDGSPSGGRRICAGSSRLLGGTGETRAARGSAQALDDLRVGGFEGAMVLTVRDAPMT